MNLTSVVVEVVDDRADTIATFMGTVRAQSRGREVIAFEYEAYEEMADEVMAGIAGEVQARYDLCKVAIAHRLGRVEVGETNVAIAVSAPHRQDTLAACARRDRGTQGARAALEEGAVRRRRGVDRPRLVKDEEALGVPRASSIRLS
jgi:molybdopterin synthase catalytic subunit